MAARFEADVMRQAIPIAGASRSFGAIAVCGVCPSGHRVFASIPGRAAHRGDPANALEPFAHDQGLQQTPIKLDVTFEASMDSAAPQVLNQAGGLADLLQPANH
jgi:NAD(P)-dependent dehydrogenase (short-subunit alcohol dehydrogenase family)